MSIYLAGPLFSEADKNYLAMLAMELESAGHEVVWPGHLLSDDVIKTSGADAPTLIFNTCRSALGRCYHVVALLDGTQVDDGTAWEIGYAYARGIPVYGLRTDTRQAGETPHNRVNSMVQGCLSGLASSVPELITMLAEAGSLGTVAAEAAKRGY